MSVVGNSDRWLAFTVIAVALLAVCTIILKLILVSRTMRTNHQTNSLNYGQQSAIPTTVSNQTAPTTTWQSYSDCTYAFKYPSSWSVQGTYADYYRGQLTAITSPLRNVVITLYPRPTPYGFGGLKSEDWQRHDLKITIEGKDYIATENIILNTKAFTDLKVQNDREYHIVFGTGYPASDDRVASLTDYYAARGTILTILSTLKIDENHPGC